MTEKYATPVFEDSVVDISKEVKDLRLAIHVYGDLVRKGFVSVEIRDLILESFELYHEITDPADLFELSLFLFSEKKWELLASVLPTCLDALNSNKFRPQLRIIGDLAYLTAHRLSIHHKFDQCTYLKNILQKDFSHISTYQKNFHNACDSFLRDPIAVQRKYISYSIKRYKPYFALKGMCALAEPSTDDGAPEFDPKITVARLSSEKNVIVVSVDIKYYEKYALSFLNQIKSVHEPVDLHIHCIGFEPKACTDTARCGLSYEPLPEHLGVAGVPERYRRTYFASARFLALDELQKHYDFIWISDIDGKITKNIAITPPASINLHSGVRRNLGKKLPMELISAANISVKSDEDGKIFARYLRQFILRRLRSVTESVWYLDQIALFCAWEDLRMTTNLQTDIAPFFNQTGNWSLTTGNMMKYNAFR